HQMGKLIADQRWNGVADVSVLVGKGSSKHVGTREPVHQRDLSHGTHPILLRVRVSTVSHVRAFTFDGHAWLLPPQPTIDVGVRAEVPSGSTPQHRWDEKPFRFTMPQQVEP